MRKILITLCVFFSFAASAQRLQTAGTYGYRFQRLAVDTLMGLPADTFAVPSSLLNVPFIANKAGTIYTWNISTHVWDAFSGGGGFFSPNQTSTGNTAHDAGGFDFSLQNVGVFTVGGNAVFSDSIKLSNLKAIKFSDVGYIWGKDQTGASPGRFNMEQIDSTKYIFIGKENEAASIAIAGHSVPFAYSNTGGIEAYLVAAKNPYANFAVWTNVSGAYAERFHVNRFGTYIEGMVGIGTLAPTRKVDIAGSLTVSDSALFPNRIRLTDTTGYDIVMADRSTGLTKVMYSDLVGGAGGASNLIVDSIGVTGTDLIVVSNDSLLHRLIVAGTGITVDTLPTRELRITATGGGGGSGDVTKVGTPVNNQIGVWTGDGTLEGPSTLLYDGTKFDLWTGYTPGMIVGAETGAATRGNSTNKFFRLAAAHYLTAEEPFNIFNTSATSGANTINYGLGVNPGMNSATEHAFYTAANNTTLAGTLRMQLANTVLSINSGLADFDTRIGGDTDNELLRADASTDRIGIGTATPNSKLHVAGSFSLPYTATATSLTMDATHHTIDVTATGQTITLPTAVGITGRIYTVKLTASGSGTVATTSSQTIDGSTTYSLSAQYKYVRVQSTNANWIIIGNN